MESNSTRHPIIAEVNAQTVLYSAVAWVAGTYTPGKKKRDPGVLVMPDGEAIRARLHWRSRDQLKKLQRDASNSLELQKYCFKVYPRTNPLSFDVMKVKPLHQQNSKRSKHKQLSPLDEFRVVGEVMKNRENRVTVCIRRNEQPPVGKESHPEYRPIYLKLEGSLDPASFGQIWELKVRRVGAQLVIKKGKLYQPSKYDLTWLEANAKQNAQSDCLQQSVVVNNCVSVEVNTLVDASERKSDEIAVSTTAKLTQQQPKQEVVPITNTTAQKTCSKARVAPTVLSTQSTSQAKQEQKKPAQPFKLR